MLGISAKTGALCTAILGFRSYDKIILDDEFRANGSGTIVCTEDGSVGVKGFVTVPLAEELAKGDTDAVFQLESGGMKRFMRDLKPNNLEDIIAGISLFRPGPMKAIPQYVRFKNHPEEMTY